MRDALYWVWDLARDWRAWVALLIAMLGGHLANRILSPLPLGFGPAGSLLAGVALSFTWRWIYRHPRKPCS